jgi:predicted phosphohydrolase
MRGRSCFVTMILCAAGDIHGALDRLYDDVQRFEDQLCVQFDWVLQVGDFGVWPDPARIDRASRNHDGAGDFAKWLEQARAAPRRTIFIKGNHEDFEWLESRRDTEILPDLWYLRSGCRQTLAGTEGDSVAVGGIGGCHGPADYARRAQVLSGYARRHYTHDEVERLAQQPAVDIVLLHDAPAGVRFETHRRGRGYVSEAAGLDTMLAQARPKVCLFGHHHTRIDSVVSGVRCLGMNKVGCPGHLVAILFEPASGQWSVLGEYSGGRERAVVAV